MLRNARPNDHERRRRPVRRAFTLLEIIVVITIIAIIATLVVPRLMGRVGDAKRKAAEAETAAIKQQVNLYLLDIGANTPDDSFDLRVLLLPPEEGGGPNGPYFEKEDAILDPWGNAYVIQAPGELNRYSFDIRSSGEDGQVGTEDDVVN